MKTKGIIFTALIIVLFLGCKKNQFTEPDPDPDPEPPVLSSDKEFIEFIITDSLNSAYLKKSTTAGIVNNEITISFPQFTNISNLIVSFEFKGVSIKIGSVVQESGKTINDFTQPLTYVIQAEDGSERTYTTKIEWEPDLKSVLPHIYITTDGNLPLVEKSVYRDGDLRIEGGGEYDDFEGRMKIKGRGNTTWSYPKKPYRIKLDSKASLFGLPAYKSWILLGEYLDGSMLYNSIPYTAGRQLGIPYTHHIIPVEVTLNDSYQGIYVFTEHKEVGKDRIDIGKDGVLLELDSYYDDPWKFRTPSYSLPVMVQYPEEEDMTQEKLDEISADFNVLEQLVFSSTFPDNDYLNYFDDTSFINYMIVYQLTDNEEINHPKSTYMNKLAGGKYRMGILWDFDWGFGYESTYKHFDISTANNNLFWTDTYASGMRFFSKILNDPHMKSLFKQKWQWYKTNKYPELKDYVTAYSGIIAPSLDKDHAKWGKRGSTGDAAQDLARTLNWLDARVAYLDNMVADW